MERQIAEVEAARDALLASKIRCLASCCFSSGALTRKLPRFSGSKVSTAISTIVASSLPTAYQPPSHGAAAASTMIELAWLWIRHQPNSALSQWSRARVQGNDTRRYRKITIIAMARKLLIALWRYVTQGVLPEGAVLKVT